GPPAACGVPSPVPPAAHARRPTPVPAADADETKTPEKPCSPGRHCAEKGTPFDGRVLSTPSPNPTLRTAPESHRNPALGRMGSSPAPGRLRAGSGALPPVWNWEPGSLTMP